MLAFGLFLAVPLIEIALFVTLGGAVGLGATLAFIFASAMLGVFMLRRSATGMVGKGGGTLRQITGSGFSMLSAVLLIMPGFFTSFLGLVLLVPLVQRGLIAVVGQRLMARGFVFSTPKPAQDDAIDGSFTVVEQPRDEGLPPSKWTQH